MRSAAAETTSDDHSVLKDVDGRLYEVSKVRYNLNW